MIAVPDFASAAMENWGAVTYRETALLIDSKNSATAVQAYVAEVIAHELAHQWFGNLVTMEWWTDLWLNEGFATYVPYLALDALFPEWQGWNQFVTTPLAEALKMDSLQNTHPIEVEVYHPNEISEIFDAVSYQKGASIIRMLAEYIGSKHFQKGLQRYLKKHAYGNAKTTDLWESFEHVSKKPVQKMMSIWTRKSGYPVLEVMRTNKNLKLRQKRFLSSVVHAQSVKDSTIWPIPLSIVSSQGEKSVGLFAKKQIQLPWDIQGWFKCNARETGLYRAAYDAATLAMFSGALKSGQLSPVDRLGIIRDLFVLSEVGSYDTVSALTMLMAYRNETEYIVLLEVVSGLRHLEILLHGTPAYKPFCEFACRILSQQLSEVTWIPIQNESHEDSLKRSLILAAGVSFGHAKTILDGVQLFQKKKIQDIHPDVRLAVYRAVARHGGAVAYNKMLTLFKKETLSEEKNRLLAGLCSFSHPDFVLRTLKLGASDEIRLQDKVRVYMNLFADPSAHDIAWNFFKKEWPKMVRMYGDGNHLISRIVLSLGRCGTAHLYKDIKNFFAKTSAPGAERSVRQMLEHIESNVRWRAREAKKIEKWLNQEQSHND
jgi:puromycin-sensitive aminopeptidase